MLVLTILLHIVVNLNQGEQTVSISSSCNNKNNGLHYIKPSPNGAIMPVICNNGYTMLDASLNYDILSTYFTSLYQYGDAHKIIYGTDCSDFSGWRDWYTPANKNTKFRIAKDCIECESGDIYEDNTAYYMTNMYFCPVQLDIDGCSDDKDLTGQTIPDIMCNICDDSDSICGGSTIYNSNSNTGWCDCYTLQLSSDHLTTNIHYGYCTNSLVYRPLLVIDRSQCTCYKPLDAEIIIYDNIQINDLPNVNTDIKQTLIDNGLYIDDIIIWSTDDYSRISDQKTCSKKITYLSQDDFTDGTYRITECGNYILTEDILVNFNKPSKIFDYYSGDSPNSIYMDNLYWFPTNEQQESGQYFGLNAFWGPYSIGFMAAITVETDHVYIDLNGYSISMDYEFYLQQRFFAIIEFGNKQFEARQGPVDFGRDDLCSKDISVKDGTLGLSSHHGIHGSCVRDVIITNLHIQNFDVTGIQCNGCKDMDITDCDIGPQNIDIPVKGRYTHGRIILARLRYLVDSYGDETIQFANRNKINTVKELADTLIEQMDMIYYHIIQGIEFDDTNIQWIKAKNTFLNPTGWMDGGSSYGILLNGFGTAVVNIGRRTGDTYNINIQNVEIHDIKVKTYEGFWAKLPAVVHGFFFETIDWLYGGAYDENTGYYLGNAYTDILFASQIFFKQDFCPLGPFFHLDGLEEWAFNDGINLFSPEINIHFVCGSDIQSHSAKGAMGIRIDGVDNFLIENVYINNIINWGDLGSDKCGEYETSFFEIGVDVDKDIQYGYTGTIVHGILTDYASGTISNVKIENLKSLYGSANAIALYKGTTATLTGNININNIIAGASMMKNDAMKLILPNPIPFVCSILIGPNSDSDTTPEFTPVITYDNDELNVIATDLYGYDYCQENQRIGVMDNVNIPEKLLNVNTIHQNQRFSIQYNISSLLLIGFSVIVVLIIMIFKGRNHDKKILKRKKIQQYGSIDSIH